LIVIEDFQFTQQSKWYLALAYLKSEEYEKAKVLLQQLNTPGSFAQQKSAEILQLLEISPPQD